MVSLFQMGIMHIWWISLSVHAVPRWEQCSTLCCVLVSLPVHVGDTDRNLSWFLVLHGSGNSISSSFPSLFPFVPETEPKKGN